MENTGRGWTEKWRIVWTAGDEREIEGEMGKE
jgi:hypothetical protein